MLKAFIGYDTNMPLAFGVAVNSLLKNTSSEIDVHPLLLPLLEAQGLYCRPTVKNKNELFDDISGFPMATEFAISRFLIPKLCGYKGWAMFSDSDFLYMADIQEAFDLCDDSKAIMCVKHNYQPKEERKMNGQAQHKYNRKNWSSFMLINCSHEKNKFLNWDNVNELAGRDLHAFSWLDDNDIGALPEEWNWLEGHSSIELKPKAVHFTRGTPDMAGYEFTQYADDWREIAKRLPICELVN